MAEYISVDTAIKHAREICPNSEDDTAYDTLCDWLDSLPKVDAVPVVHAHWLGVSGHGDVPMPYVCSRCGRTCVSKPSELSEVFPYCHCGAKMKEEG